MEIKNQNQPDNHIDYFAPKIMWLLIGILLLVVIVGSILWWKEVKKQNELGKQLSTFKFTK